MKLNVQINFEDLMGRGFACYLSPSARETGIAQVKIDIDAMLNACAENDIADEFKAFFCESVLHEILHGIEELYEKSFVETRINNAINKAAETYKYKHESKTICK